PSEIGMRAEPVNIDGIVLILLFPDLFIGKRNSPIAGDPIVDKQFPLAMLGYFGLHQRFVEIRPNDLSPLSLQLPRRCVELENGGKIAVVTIDDRRTHSSQNSEKNFQKHFLSSVAKHMQHPFFISTDEYIARVLSAEDSALIATEQSV